MKLSDLWEEVPWLKYDKKRERKRERETRDIERRERLRDERD